MKYFLPIIFGLIVLSIVNFSIFQKEKLIKNGKSIFVQLVPVDPRSMIQGDYMFLRYYLHFQDINTHLNYQFFGKKTLKTTLDNRSIVINSIYDDNLSLKENEYLLKVKSSGHGFYPGADSYMFAEGLAYCYDQAKFAHFKVAKDGELVLYKLHGEDLEPLDCEEKQRILDENLSKN